MRNDFIRITAIVLLSCAAVMFDPDKFFEWLAFHKEVQVDEILAATVILGLGFGIFSWRRWTDLSNQVNEYKRLQAELSGVNRDVSLMSETDDLLQSCLSSKEAYRIIIRHMKAQLPESSGAICVMGHGKEVMEIVAQWGEPSIADTTFAPEDCWGLRRGRVNRMLASTAPLYCEHIGTEPPTYAMCVPMMAQGETLGVMYLDSGDGGGKRAPAFQQLSDAEERVVKTLAEHLALAVANLNLREALRTQSIRDPLTGLFNRRYMEESLERELHRASRKKTSLTVIMVDVDHFKRLNDTFGHEAGDEVLRELARIFRTQLRVTDVACRYGGEEFVLILPDASPEGARERAEQFREAVKNSRIIHRGASIDSVTISLGLSCCPADGTTAEMLLRSADEALYRAKESGRNRVVMASPVDAHAPAR